MNSIETAKIKDGAIVRSKIGLAAVETDNIRDANVTGAKLASSAVTTPKIADSAVTKIKLASNSVGYLEIIDGSITTPKIVNGAVTQEKLAPAIVLTKIATGSYTGDGTDDRVITVGFQPKAVVVYRQEIGNHLYLRCDADQADTCFRISSGTVVNQYPWGDLQNFTPVGFKLSTAGRTTTNISGAVYSYIAFG